VRECSGVSIGVGNVVTVGADRDTVVTGGTMACVEEGSLGIVTLFSQ
jgi:hypothetical protein